MEAPEMTADFSRAQADVQAARGKLKISRLTYRRLRQTAYTAGAVAPGSWTWPTPLCRPTASPY